MPWVFIFENIVVNSCSVSILYKKALIDGENQLLMNKSHSILDIRDIRLRKFSTATHYAIEFAKTKWKQEYEQAEHTFISWKKYVWVGTFALIAASVATPLIAVTARRDVPIGPVIGASVIGVAGGGLMITAMVIRSSAKEKMELLLNQGRIKGYIRICRRF